MRISEKEAKSWRFNVLGVIAEYKGDFSLKAETIPPFDTDLGKIHGNASYYRLVNGKVVEMRLKLKREVI